MLCHILKGKNEIPLPVHISPEHDRAIREHSRETFPNECCGILIGRDESALREVVMVLPAGNSRDEPEQHHRFAIEPRALLEAEKIARAQKLDVLGFYHSHPNAPARPSKYDREHAWPVYSYIIVSVRDGEAKEMTSWQLREDRGGYDEERLVISKL
jgi:proteasome lid subunit RPN8/RPN11